MTSSTNIYKKAISHTAIYGASDVLRRIVGFIMLPIYTHYLTPADYGVVELMMMAIIIVEILFGMRMGQAIFRYYYMAKEIDDKRAVISTTFFMVVCTSTLAFIILAANSGTAAEIMIGDTRYEDLMRLLSILLITQAIESYWLIYVRVQQRAVFYFVLSVLKLMTSLSLNIYFIVYLELAVAGVVYSAIISTALMAVLGFGYILYYAGIRFSKALLKQLVIFSYPLWIAAGGAFYSDSAVKYFLRVYSGLDDVGLYVLAAKFAALIFVFVWMPFSNIWDSLRYEVYKMPKSIQIYKNIFVTLILVFSIVGLGLSLFSSNIIYLISDKAFWPAGDVVPILAIASIVMGLTSFNNFGILLKGRTGIIAVGTYLDSIVITIGFVIFIPMFNLYGAAITVLIGKLVQLIWIEWKSKALYDMQLPWRRAIVMSVTWVCCYSLSLLLPETMLISIVGKLLILICFILLMIVLPILEKKEKQQIRIYLDAAVTKVSSYFAKEKSV